MNCTRFMDTILMFIMEDEDTRSRLLLLAYPKTLKIGTGMMGRERRRKPESNGGMNE